MKKIIILPFVIVTVALLAVTACMKKEAPSCTPYTITRDRQIIDSLLGADAGTYTFDNQASLYYRIDNAGFGNAPLTDSLVSFNYVGRILNGLGTGAIVDSLTINPPATNRLSYFSSLIGVLYSLQKIREGGTISVIIPSSQLFGCNGAQGVNPVPANSQLIYRYNLTDVKYQ